MFRRIAITVACIFALAQSSFAADEWAVGTWIQNYDWGKNDAHGQTTWTLDAEGNANESGGGLQMQKRDVGSPYQKRGEDHQGLRR